MKSAHPDGFEQPVIATLLHGVLKAIAYLHAHGHIHRDVKVCQSAGYCVVALLISSFGFICKTSLFALAYNYLHLCACFTSVPFKAGHE